MLSFQSETLRWIERLRDEDRRDEDRRIVAGSRPHWGIVRSSIRRFWRATRRSVEGLRLGYSAPSRCVTTAGDGVALISARLSTFPIPGGGGDSTLRSRPLGPEQDRPTTSVASLAARFVLRPKLAAMWFPATSQELAKA